MIWTDISSQKMHNSEHIKNYPTPLVTRKMEMEALKRQCYTILE